MILALAGGVGGAKLASGMAMQLPPDKLQIVVNTGDDFVHLGLHISPDIDTVMYWLSGLNDRARGWGIAGETWNFMAALERLGGPTWFKLGDRDLATHIMRTRLLQEGKGLSDVTRSLCRQLGIGHRVAPMTDEPMRTIVHTDEGALEFQQYFVRRQCAPRVRRLEYRGVEIASPSTAFEQSLASDELQAIVICPSNPVLSIDPIMSLPGVRAKIAQSGASVVAVSPLVAGRAIKGPAAKIMRELDEVVSAFGVAVHYGSLLDGMVIDTADAALQPAIEALGVRVSITDTVMTSQEVQKSLAEVVLDFARLLSAETARLPQR